MKTWIIKKIKRIKSYWTYNFEFLKIYNSPFKNPKIKWYYGPIAIGVPYFLPRKWIKVTEEEAIQSTKEIFAKDYLPFYYQNKTFDQVLADKRKSEKAIPIKFGFNFCTLGWKTKWDEFRHEWNPIFSFVAFNRQITFGFVAPDKERSDTQYWEAWLNYKYETNKKNSKLERFDELFRKHSCTWKKYLGKNDYEITDYYLFFLKKKYLKYYLDNKSSLVEEDIDED